MIWIIVIIGIIVCLIISKTPTSKNKIEVEVVLPNPEKCTDESFFDFVKKTPIYKLEAILKELDKKNVYLKPAFRNAILDKINYLNTTNCSTSDIVDNKVNLNTENENYIDFELKGTHLKIRKLAILEICKEGDLVELIDEPNNKYDSNAVVVKRFGKILGYLDKDEVFFYHAKKHLFKNAIIELIDYDKYNDYLYVEIRISFFTEDDLLKHSEYEDLKTNKITKKYLYPKKDLNDTSNYFYNKKVVITGTFENFPYRNEMAKMLWEVGADIDVSVSTKTDIIIMGINSGWRKQENAEELQIECIDENIFMSYFSNYTPIFNKS